jgi:meiotically up-regulated gene 157 (Mug157) protein
LALTTRRSVLRGCLTAAVTSAVPLPFAAFGSELPEGRPALADRRFTSPAIESAISTVKGQMADPKLAAMFERCLPNALDTTVFPGTLQGKPDTYVVTGDIDAMWLRDSAAQVQPYLRFARQDPHLSALLEGLVRRHARMVLIDPYANAFTRNPSDPPLSWAAHDKTTMAPGVAEHKWEIDSLCYILRLAHGYWRSTGNTAPFDQQWKAAAWKILATFREQQRLHAPGPYSFGRLSTVSSEDPPLNGYGNPARPEGMIFSMFRPSDDACIYPFLIPANLFAVQSLAQLQEIATQVLADDKLAAECADLCATLRQTLASYGTCRHPAFGTIWAYEADGYGNVLMMDDANAPSLLSLPYLGICSSSDALYQRTRQFVLSNSNPYFFAGKAAAGVGSPHTGLGQIWPLAIILRALTSSDDDEIAACLRTLRDTTAGTGFMHESFDVNDPRTFTRPWFAWANTLFGELILQLADTRPALLRQTV